MHGRKSAVWSIGRRTGAVLSMGKVLLRSVGRFFLVPISEKLYEADIILLSGFGRGRAALFAITQNDIAHAFVIVGDIPGRLESAALFAFKDFPGAPDVAGIHADSVGGVEQVADDQITVGSPGTLSDYSAKRIKYPLTFPGEGGIMQNINIQKSA